MRALGFCVVPWSAPFNEVFKLLFILIKFKIIFLKDNVLEKCLPLEFHKTCQIIEEFQQKCKQIDEYGQQQQQLRSQCQTIIQQIVRL